MIDEIIQGIVFVILAAISDYAIFDIVVFQGGSDPIWGIIWSIIVDFFIFILVAVNYIRTVEQKQDPFRSSKQ